MNNPIIKIENLSKSYFIGHEKQQRYTALRDVLVDNFKGWGRGVSKLFQKGNHPLVMGDEIEEFWALKDVSLEINKGEAVGIIGRNGAGKSTLLKLLSRITEPTKGRIEINGRVASLLEVGTGFHPELTGRENIFLNGAILGMTRHEIKSKFDEIVDFSGVEKFLDTPVKRYSSGMYVRLAFSVAAHLEPDILIVDEVLAVGDAEFQEKCLGKMDEVSKGEGRSVIFVSHNLSSIRQLCRKGILLEKGQIAFTGTSEDTIECYIKNKQNQNITNKFQKKELENKDIQLIAAEVLNKDGDFCSEFQIVDEIFIKLIFLCRKIIPNTYGYVNIKNAQEELIIETDTFDYLPNCLDDMKLGENTYLIKISPNILACGKYRFYLSLASSFSDNFGLDNGDFLVFSITDSVTQRGMRRTAKTSYLLNWKKQT